MRASRPGAGTSCRSPSSSGTWERRWAGCAVAAAAGEPVSQAAFERALELLDLTLADPRWRGRRREIARAREMLCDAALGGREYGSTLEGLDRYFLAFAVLARRGR